MYVCMWVNGWSVGKFVCMSGHKSISFPLFESLSPPNCNGSRKLCTRPLQLHAVEPNIHLLVVEAQLSRHDDALGRREAVPPDGIAMLLLSTVDVIVVCLALVGAPSRRLALAELRPVDRGGRQVVPRRQPRFEEGQRRVGFGDELVVDFDHDVAAAREDVHALVRVFGVYVDRLVFFVPGVCVMFVELAAA